MLALPWPGQLFSGLLIGLPGLALVGCALAYRHGGSLSLLLAGCGIASGLAYGGYQASEALQARLPVCIDRDFHELQIKVVSDPVLRPAGGGRRASAKFGAVLMAPIDTGGCAAGAGVRVQLSWYEPPQLRRDDIWMVELRLRPPWGYQNPGGFDYERWLYAQRYQGTGYVRRGELVSSTAAGSAGAGFANYLKSADTANPALIRALALGDGSAISQQQWELFRRTGTVHLMVVSGLHIGLVTGVSYWLFSWLLRLLPQVLNPLRLATLLALSVAAAFVWSTGAGVPAMRAWLMAAVVMISLLLGRRVSRLAVFLVALVVIIVLDPLVVHQTGFYLSFTAVGVLLWVSAKDSVQRPFVLALLITQLVLFVALTPVLAMTQARVAGIGGLSNLFAVPLLSLILPAILGSYLLLPLLPGVAELLLWVSDWLLDVLLVLLEWFGQAPLLNAGAGSFLQVLLSLLAAGGLLNGARGPWRWLLLASWLVWLAPTRPQIPFGEFQLTALDVGQGSAIIVDTHGHRLLFDAGPGYPGGFNLGDAAVVPTLLRSGKARLDVLILSHDDLDHTGGQQAVVEAIPIGRVYASFSSERDTEVQIGTPYRRCRKNTVWVWDGVQFEFLNPEPAATTSDNDRSCVLKVSSGQRRVLLSGDISAATERRILRHDALQVDLLLAPHHGSRTSSSKRWVQSTQPAWVLVSAPRRSRYGHPHPDVVERYLDAGARLAITGYSGALVWRSWKADELEQWRCGNRAYWLNPPLRWAARAHPDDGSSPATD